MFEKMVKVEVLRNCGCRNFNLQAGKTKEIPERDAKELVQMGKVRYVLDEAEKNAKEAAAEPVTPAKELTEPEKIGAIIDEIQNLDPDDDAHFTKSGMPNCTVLTERCGFQVTKKLRDKACAQIPDPDEGADPKGEGQDAASAGE